MQHSIVKLDLNILEFISTVVSDFCFASAFIIKVFCYLVRQR